MMFNYHTSRETAENCLRLVENYAGKLARASGGKLSGGRTPPVTDQERAEVVAYLRQHPDMPCDEIGVHFKRSPACIGKILRESGIFRGAGKHGNRNRDPRTGKIGGRNPEALAAAAAELLPVFGQWGALKRIAAKHGVPDSSLHQRVARAVRKLRGGVSA